MAREHQGLQIALIIFVMLTIVLSVTTFVFFNKWGEAIKTAKENEDNANTQMSKANTLSTECEELKKLIGYPKSKSLPEMQAQWKSDMEAFAGTYPEDARYYSPLLPRLAETNKGLQEQVKDAVAKLDEFTEKYKVRDNQRNDQVKTFENAVAKSGADLQEVTKSFDAQREKTVSEQATLVAHLDQVRKEAKEVTEKAEQKVDLASKKMAMLSGILGEKNRQIEKFNRPTMDVPSGEIRWVDQQHGLAWINLGRADYLERQTSFSVYSGDSNELNKSTKKANIEVTKIIGDHVAEARIVGDKLSDPLMPGDKIFTPLWTPGEQSHFALCGRMDINGNGSDDSATVRNLITMSGGLIDCELQKTKRVGDLTPRTRYLVLGEEADAKGAPEEVAARSRLLSDADRLGVRRISLTDLKEKMGYHPQATVQRFGQTTNPHEVRSPGSGSSRGAGGTSTRHASGKAADKAEKADKADDTGGF
jgi:hypothetical protein